MNDGSSRYQRFIYCVPFILLEYSEDWTETCTATLKFADTKEEAKAECSKRDDCDMFLEKCVKCSLFNEVYGYYFCEKGSDNSDWSWLGGQSLYRKQKCRYHDLLDIIFVDRTFVAHFRSPPP